MADLATFLIYENASKEILGIFRLSPQSATLYPRDPVNQTKIDLISTHPIIHEQLRWKVNSIGDDVDQKAVVSISVDKTSIVADGVDEALLSFSGLTAPINVSFGDGLTHIVIPTDPNVQLTSDVPRRFVVGIDDKLHFADPVVVEAR